MLVFDIKGKKGIAMQFIGLLIAAAIIGIDRYTKWLVEQKMALHQSISVIKIGDREVLNLSYYLNDGAAFSKFEGKTTMLIIVTSIIIITLIALVIMKKVKRPSYIVAISLIVGGGIGNLIDRIFNEGMVVDFIDFRLIQFAIFNFADIAAVCGAGLIMLLALIDEIKSRREKREAAKAGITSTQAADGTEASDDGKA